MMRPGRLKDLLLRDPEHTENHALSLLNGSLISRNPRVLRGQFVYDDDDHEVGDDDDDDEA